jgi:diguanylate cyclase (GGDEF)-like protein
VLTVRPFEALRPWSLSWELLVTLVLGVTARFLAFRVFNRVRVALDSALYVAATFAFGLVPAAWVVLLALTADAVVRTLRGSGVAARGLSPMRYVFAQGAYSGGLPALVLLWVGIAFNVDGRHPHSDLTLLWLLPAFGGSFLFVHYLVAGGAHWFSVAVPKELWREFLYRVAFAEASLVPLSLAMVLGYNHQGTAYFLLLGCSGLLFTWIFRNARVAREKLAARVQELQTLNKVGHIISGSLQRDVLLKNISTETLRLVGHSSRFLIGLLDEEREVAQYEMFDDHGRYRQLAAPADEGLSGYIMQTRMPLLMGDVQRQHQRVANSGEHVDSEYRSWLGVPLVTYDEVMGVMSVQSKQRDAYTEDHLRVLKSIADQAAVALENSRLYELATVDGLTRLFVRRQFDHRLLEEWRRARRYDYPFALGILDVDNFKEINDTHGHQAGDRVLRAAASVLRRNMRGPDLAGRYGGEEFAFLLPRTTVAQACQVAERIRAEIAAMRSDVSGVSVAITTSIGVAGYPESGPADVEELIAQADEALYQAKRSGKNRIATAPSKDVERPRTVEAGRS